MPGIVRSLNHQVIFAGNELENVMSYRFSLGYDQPVGEATVTCATAPGGGDLLSELSIIVDGSTRWSGLVYDIDHSLYPRSASLICKGRLQRAADFKLPDEYSREEKGLLLSTLTGSDNGATDQAIVSAVLNAIDLDLNGGSIGGTGTVLGTIAPETFTWNANDSALGYIQKIDSISVGYRTFESAGGSIFRTQVSSVPGGSSTSLTEGVDIIDGSSSITVLGAFSRVRVTGYSVGDYEDPRVWVASGSDIFGWPVVYTVNNEMIERRADSSPGAGRSCESLAGYWLNELNRFLVKVQLKTPRSDVFGPGQSHHVSSGERLGIDDTMWLQRVDGELSPQGGFSQTLTYVGGGG